MFRDIARLVAVLLIAAPVSLPAADDVKPSGGKLVVAGKEYRLKHVAAYATKNNDDDVTAVLASDRPIPVAEVKAVLKENDGEDDELSLSQTHVRVKFDKEGKPIRCSMKATGFSSETSGDNLTGELKLEGGRATGKATLAEEGEGSFRKSFEFEFAVGVLGSSAEEAQKADPLAKLGASGTFKGNGKDAKIAFVSAHVDEEFSGKPSLKLIFTEKDHSKDKQAGFKASFGDYGSAIIISCHEDGGIFGCQVSHAAHEKRGFSSIGSIEMTEFQVAGGQVQGTLTTNGEAETFGETWEVNLKFAAPYKSQIATPETKPARDKPVSDKPVAEKLKPEPTKPAEALNAKKLAFPKGAADFNYKAIVQMLDFKCPGDVKAVATEFSKNLAAQGWKSEPGDLVTANSAILMRSRGEATLTIFVKPAEGGSTVSLHTEGLNWDE